MGTGFEEYGYVLAFVFMVFCVFAGLLIKGASHECRSFRTARLLSRTSYGLFVMVLVVLCVVAAGAVVDSLIQVV